MRRRSREESDEVDDPDVDEHDSSSTPFASHSRISVVSKPIPMEVKKLIAKLTFRADFGGNNPQNSCKGVSLAFSLSTPIS